MSNLEWDSLSKEEIDKLRQKFLQQLLEPIEDRIREIVGQELEAYATAQQTLDMLSEVVGFTPGPIVGLPGLHTKTANQGDPS